MKKNRRNEQVSVRIQPLLLERLEEEAHTHRLAGASSMAYRILADHYGMLAEGETAAPPQEARG